MIDEDADHENWVDHSIPSSWRSRASDANDNDDGEGKQDTQGGEKVTGKDTGGKDGNGKEKWKGKGKGNRKGKGIVKQTPEGDDICRAIVLQSRKELYEADSDSEG